MKYGFVLSAGDARDAADLAEEAERAGWDGVFVSEPVWGIDAWVSLTAAAMRTRKVRLGTMLTPISRMRPWDVAGRAASLDNLSGGRVTLSVGLGAPESGFADFGEVTDRRTRAELMDEGLAIITGLWKGQPFRHEGKHYTVREYSFVAPPPPKQRPRIPIWVVGAWPSATSMRRVLRYDGLLPMVASAAGTRQATHDEVRAMREWCDTRRGRRRPIDIIVEGTTRPGRRGVAAVDEWVAAGATWWIEANWVRPTVESLHRRLRAGPPRA